MIILLLLAYSVFADERKECKLKATDVSDFAYWIERGVYDPCDDAGDGFYRGMCATAHVEVAERRLRRVEEKILSLYATLNLSVRERDQFIESQKIWLQYRESYCLSTEPLQEINGVYLMSLRWVCFRRMTEKHAEELEYTLSDISNKL